MPPKTIPSHEKNAWKEHTHPTMWGSNMGLCISEQHQQKCPTQYRLSYTNIVEGGTRKGKIKKKKLKSKKRK